MRRLRFSGRLGPFDAAQSRLAPAAKARKCQKNHQALDAGGGGDVKMGSEMGLERFQAQHKWEIPVHRRLRFCIIRIHDPVPCMPD